MLARSIADTVGSTPLVDISALAHKRGADESTKVYAKLEYFNPSSSVKDRAALGIILAAEKNGALKPGGTIVEATSGNTGIALAALAASRGYKMVVCMPETMSLERRQLMKHLGAELVLTPGDKGIKGALEEAQRICDERGAIMARQFENEANVEMHRQTTGPEIWNDTYTMVDVFIAGIGSGGTLSGAGMALKELNSQIEVVAVEPSDSAVLSGKEPGKHGIQGIGPGFIAPIVRRDLIDKICTVETEDAYQTSRALAQEAGILAGISSGAAVKAAFDLAAQEEYKDKTLVVILPDTAERYLSTPLFED